MKVLLDHDVPVEINRVLKQAGHDIATVEGALVLTATDAEVFNFAVSAKRVLVTCNRDDFIEAAKGRQHAGLIVLIRRKTRIAECAALLRLIERAGSQGIDGNINFA